MGDVKTGLFGGAESFVPLADATSSGTEIRVPFDESKVKDAPRVDDFEGHLSADEESELYRYYGMSYTDPKPDSGVPTDGAAGRGGVNAEDGTERAVGRDTPGPNADDA